MWPECVGSSWMTKASMPLTGPQVPQIRIQLRPSGTLCIGASDAAQAVQELTDDPDQTSIGCSEVPPKVSSTEYTDPSFASSAPAPIVGINGMGPPQLGCPLDDPVIGSSVEGVSVEQPFSEDRLKESLKKQLEFCFSRENLSKDLYLMSQMDSDQFVPIWTVASMEGIKVLTTDMDLILEVLRASSMVQVDESGEKVRPNHKRCIIILREVPETTPVEEVENLFKNENCPKVIGVEFAANNNWYITFHSDTDAQQAHRYLREEVRTFQGKPIMARIKAVNTFFAKNGYRNSSVYSQPGQSPYTSPGIYMQQVYRPQQQYPLYPVVPPTWSPSPAPYFETPLAPFPNGFVNGFRTPGNFKPGSGPPGLGRLAFNRNRSPVKSYPRPCEEAPSLSPVGLQVDGQSGHSSPPSQGGTPEPDAAPPSLSLMETVPAASEPSGDLGSNSRGRRCSHRGMQRRREDDRSLRHIPLSEVKVPQPRFDLATSNFPPLPGCVVSVQGEHLLETRMSDVVRGLKVVTNDKPEVKECVTYPTSDKGEPVSMPSPVASVLVEPPVLSVSLPVKKVEKPELNVQMETAPTHQIQPPTAVKPAPTPTSSLATLATTTSSSTEPRKLSYAEMCKRPATQLPAPSNPSSPPTSASQPLRELRGNKADEPASSSRNMDGPEKPEGSGEGRPQRDPRSSFRGGSGPPRPGGMGLKSQRQQRGATVSRRISPQGRVRWSGKEQNIPPSIAKVVYTD
ncbi:la-related protein 4 isoform X1 [Esox lucius]|nr:la-related protein 4 isoform X1 [Esox lucius]